MEAGVPSCAGGQHVSPTLTCVRCGGFGCSACFHRLEDADWCGACFERQVLALPPLSSRIGPVRVTLGLLALSYAVDPFLAVAHEQHPASEVLPKLTLAVNLVGVPVWLAAVVAFCRWFHLAVRTATNRGVEVGATPASAVASWFIPLLNLVRPFKITRRLLATGKTPLGGTALVWQALWILGGALTVPEFLLEVASQSSGASDAQAALFGTWSLLLLTGRALLLVAAAGVGAAVVNQVTRRLTP